MDNTRLYFDSRGHAEAYAANARRQFGGTWEVHQDWDTNGGHMNEWFVMQVVGMPKSMLTELHSLLKEFRAAIDNENAISISRASSLDLAARIERRSMENLNQIDFVIRYVKSKLN